MGATQPQMPPSSAPRDRRHGHDMSTALALERSGDVRILTRFGQLVKDFHIHVIFATNKVIREKPEALRGFLKAVRHDCLHARQQSRDRPTSPRT